jgi:hypothetical protein
MQLITVDEVFTAVDRALTTAGTPAAITTA